MENITSRKKCPGCGYVLQCIDSKKLGYIPPKTVKTAKYCERCFKIIHYNDAKIVINPMETKKLIDLVNKNAKFVFFLIDFLNLNMETIEVFKRITVDKCLVISKSDIIPRSVKEHRLSAWIKNEYKVDDEIIFVSAYKNYNINKIPNMMEEMLIEKAHILGFTNAGKSSLINKIYENNQKVESEITTSVVPNTTMDFIYMKIKNNLTLVDSPGFVLQKNVYENDDIEFIKKVNARIFIKPVTYQIKTKMSIILEDRFRFEYQSEEKNSMTFYLSSKIELDKLYENNERLKNQESKVFRLNGDNDLVIKGVGFINIKKPCKIKIYSKYLELIEVRNSCF